MQTKLNANDIGGVSGGWKQEWSGRGFNAVLDHNDIRTLQSKDDELYRRIIHYYGTDRNVIEFYGGSDHDWELFERLKSILGEPEKPNNPVSPN